jgi:hypothetical protein
MYVLYIKFYKNIPVIIIVIKWKHLPTCTTTLSQTSVALMSRNIQLFRPDLRQLINYAVKIIS